MGKGQRARESRVGQKEEQRKIAAKKKKQSLIKKVIGISLTSIVAVAIVAILVFNIFSSTGILLRNTVAMKSDNFDVTNAMMTYFVKNQFFTFSNQYGDSLSNMGIDTQKTLASQQCAIAEGTWLDYFLNLAKDQVNDILLFAEKAKEKNIELTDEDKKAIEENLNTFRDDAKNNNVSLGQYYSLVFAEGMSEKDVKKALELQTLASKYYEEYEKSVVYSDEDYQKYFNENESTFIKADYMMVTVPGDNESDIKNNAKIFEKAKNVEEFTKLLTDLITSQETEAFLESNKIESEANLTDSQKKELKENIDTAVEAATSTAYKPAADAKDTSEFNKWLFEDGRKVDDIYTATTEADEEKKTTFSIKVYMVKKVAYFDDNILMKARHIMFTAEKYESDEAAKAKAEEVLAKYKENPTEENFIALAKEFSEDAATAENGGLYEEISEDTTAWPFSEWVYAEGRKAGDVEVVKTELGYHIMYFVGEGNVAWKTTAKAAMLNDDYDAHIEDLAKTYTITKFDDKMKSIKA